jgi:RNA polymerase sigma-70 factor (ECF subfamily)
MIALLKQETDTRPSEDDAELLRRVAMRDRVAFAQLYDRLSGVLYSTAIRILNDTREAEDVLQEVFLQIWEKAGSYDPSLGRPFSWVLTLTRNRAIDRLRSLRRRSEFIAEATETAVTTHLNRQQDAGEIYDRDQSQMIRRALEGLPLEQRQAIEMAFLGGMTQTEISDQLGQPLGTIKARIRRGVMRLREVVGEWL